MTPASPLLRCLAGLALASILSTFALPALSQPAGAEAPLPRLHGRTLQDTPVDLAGLRGRVVLLYLWSTDCPVCLRELPELRRNLQGWKGRPFTVVAVNLDHQAQALRDYEAILDRLAPPSSQMQIVWRGAAGHQDSLGNPPMNTPTSIVLDRQGRAVEQVQGPWSPALWDRMAELVVE